MPAPRRFRIMFWNAQGITNLTKRIQLEQLIIDQQIDIILLAETFLKQIHDFKISNFTVYRNDRLLQARGGVAIILRNSLSHKLRTPLNTNIIENLSVEIILNNSPICITVAYSPKYSNQFARDMDLLYNQTNNYMIFGDFNARHTSWNCVSNNRAGTVLFDLQQEQPSMIYNTPEHTHYPHSGQTPSTIDLLISNTNVPFDLYTHDNHISSDHAPIVCSTQAVLYEQRSQFFDYQSADWNKYRRFIDSNIGPVPNLASSEDIDIQIERFTDLLVQARGICIPEKSFKKKFEISAHARQLIQMKNRIRRQWQRAHTEPVKNLLKRELNSMQRNINTVIAKEHNNYWSDQLRNISKGNKKLWDLTKRFKGKMDSNVSKILLVNTQSTDDGDRANCLANIFERAHTITQSFTHENDTQVRTIVNAFHTFSNMFRTVQQITLEEVIQTLSALRPYKAPGPDTIQNIMLKQLPLSAILWLCGVLNNCLMLGYWPSKFKIAKVIPILKAGKSPSDANNYRPISLLNATGKIMEKIIYNRLNNVIEEKSLIPNFQFGFRRGHSTIQQAMRIKRFISNEKQCKRSSGMILLDIEKAFDSIWHDGLIFKLIKLKIPSYLLKIIDSFIRDRKFAVQVNNHRSREISIPAGLAQGTCISPILYSLFVADIPTQSENTQIALYADDTAIYTSAKHSNTIVRKLNEALSTLQQFFHKWKIKINANKTQAIIFPFNRSRHRVPSVTFKNDQIPIEISKSVKYLGVVYDHKLRFAEHIACAIIRSNNCFKSFYPLLAPRSHLSIENKHLIFKVVIRPIMAYGCPVWYTAANIHINRLVVLQKKILKIIHKLPRRTPSALLEEITGFIPFNSYIDAYNDKFFNNCLESNFELIRGISRV